MSMNKTQLIEWLGKLAAVYADKKEYLTELDAAIGDADHGINMNRGFSKVMEKLPTVEDKDIGTILKNCGHDAHVQRGRSQRSALRNVLDEGRYAACRKRRS